MKTRLELAHEYAIAYITESLKVDLDFDFNHQLISLDAFSYADSMLAENEKREQDKRERHDFVPAIMEGVRKAEEEEQEWQPDWSVAPEWANWWAMDLDNNQAHWFEVEPIIDGISWYRRTRVCKQSSDFNYQGNWRDSLRKRPEGK